MPKLELFGGSQQVPAVSKLLIGVDESNGDTVIYITTCTDGPPFGPTPSIRPFVMKDGDLYGARLRDILQHEVEHGGENAVDTVESYCVRAKDNRFLAYLFEEFAAKFHQKALNCEARAACLRLADQEED